MHISDYSFNYMNRNEWWWGWAGLYVRDSIEPLKHVMTTWNCKSWLHVSLMKL